MALMPSFGAFGSKSGNALSQMQRFASRSSRNAKFIERVQGLDLPAETQKAMQEFASRSKRNANFIEQVQGRNAATPARGPVENLTFEQAVKRYQARYPSGGTREAYEGIFPYLESLGFKVARPTRSARDAQGNRLLSSDKVVNAATGEVRDVIGSVDEMGSGKWAYHQDKNFGYWIPDGKGGGKASRTPIPGSTAGMGTTANELMGAAPAGGSVLGSTGSAWGSGPFGDDRPKGMFGVRGMRQILQQRAQGSVLGDVAPVNPYAAAQMAAMRQRGRATQGGRNSTILGGFATGRPKTRQTILGGYS